MQITKPIANLIQSEKMEGGITIMFKTVEQITNKFIKDGWSNNTSFEELELKEAEEKGLSFVIEGIKKGKKYFKMSVCNNIYNDSGKIVLYNIPAIKTN